MPKYLTVSEAQQQLPQLADELAGEPAIITKDGKPVMVALDLSQFESLLETVEILSELIKCSSTIRAAFVTKISYIVPDPF